MSRLQSAIDTVEVPETFRRLMQRRVTLERLSHKSRARAALLRSKLEAEERKGREYARTWELVNSRIRMMEQDTAVSGQVCPTT